MKNLFVFLAEGLEEIEAIATVDILRRAGLQVQTISISDRKEVKGAHNITVVADKLFSEIENSEADCLILPGGMPGSTHLDQHEGLGILLKKQAARNGWIAAICAAPTVLGHLGLLQNKKATCYPGFESELIGAYPQAQKTVVDGNIITANGPGSAFAFGLTIVEQLLGQEAAKEVAQGMLL